MDRYSTQAGRVILGVLVAAAIAVGSITGEAMSAGCGSFCGGCFVVYTDCEACDGGGCDLVGMNCDGACWYCGGDDNGCGQ